MVILPLPKHYRVSVACLFVFGFAIWRSRIAEKPNLHLDLKTSRSWNSDMILPTFCSQRPSGYTFNGTIWAVGEYTLWGTMGHLSKRMLERTYLGFRLVFCDLGENSRTRGFALNLILLGSRSNFKTRYLNIIQKAEILD